jgi:hypothetical protein
MTRCLEIESSTEERVHVELSGRWSATVSSEMPPSASAVARRAAAIAVAIAIRNRVRREGCCVLLIA